MKPWLKMLAVFLLIVVVLGGLFALRISKLKAAASVKPPPEVVSTFVAQNINWDKTLTAVGSLKSKKGVDLSVEVTGIIDRIKFKSGAHVKQGDEIIAIRADDIRAQLESLRAQAQLANENYLRDEKQYKAQVISKAQFDATKSSRSVALAAIQAQEAMLRKYTLRAPFSGKLGIITPEVGQYITVGTKVASLQDASEVFADFYLPQSELAHVSVGQQIELFEDSRPNKIYEGSIIAIDSKVDSDTRNINIRAQLRNDDGKLFAGMFANVLLKLDTYHQALSLPQTAIVFSPYGQSVYITSTAGNVYNEQLAKLKEEGADAKKMEELKKPEDEKAKVAKQVFVKTGAKRGDQIEILSGIKAGDEVVTSGQSKIKNGTLISVNNKVVPENKSGSKRVDE